jgi:hypothetical protein
MTLINDSRSNANYRTVEIAAIKRLSDRWQLLASYSATRIHVPYQSDVKGGKTLAAVAFTPNAEISAANNTWDWQTRLSGSYLFPANIEASANFENRSGEAWARRVTFEGGQQIPSIDLWVEPIGSRRLPSVNMLTLRAEKAFRVKAGHRMAVRAQVYNALNVNNVTGALSTSGLNQKSGKKFMFAKEIVSPRIGEVALTYAF